MSDRKNKGKNIIAFPDEYICIDTETTGLDFEYDEIIEISAIRVQNGKIVDKFSSLVKPSRSHFFVSFGDLSSLGYDSFEAVPDDVYRNILDTHLIPEYITTLTGITNEMLFAAPTARDVFPSFVNFVSGSMLVGHNVNFDINFLYDACEQCDAILNNNFVDTMRIARKLYPEMKHHRLSDIAVHLGIEQTIAHRAEADTITTFKCYEAMRNVIEEKIGFEEFIQSFEHKTSVYRDNLLSIVPTVTSFDETNPIFGKYIVFTGALSNMSRKDAFQFVANMGGYPQETITKETNFLIVGNTEFADSVKNGRTNKMKKADKYREKGQDIVVLSEDTFFQMLD